MRLYVVGARGAGKVHHLSEGDRFSVGRSADCHIQFLDPTVSKKHCEVGIESGHAFVRDLKSRNGTFVGSGRVAHAELHDGDHLRAGKLLMEVYLTAEKAAPPRKSARCVSCHKDLPPERTRLCAECSSRPDPFVGTKVRNYRVIELIGRGGMAAVYKAEQEPLSRIVALKILLADPIENKSSYERFLRGAKVNSRFDHPNIVRLYDAGFDRGVCYLAMEYVDGESLQDKLDRVGKMREEEAVRCALEIASALECLHSRKIVHRDVKPANVLFTSGGVTKLTDMGISKELAQSGLTWLTSTGLGLGTLHFMAPEQMEDAKRADARSDLYALGATLYAMVAGRPPFHANSTIELIRMVQEVEPDPPAGASKKVETAIWRLLRKSPSERFSSAAELMRELG